MEREPTKPPDKEPARSQTPDRTIRTHAYTGRLSTFVTAGMAFTAMRDLKHQESSQILLCFGLSSIGWGWFWVILGLLLTWWIAGRISLNVYFMRAVNDHKDRDPIDPWEAGIIDISFLICLLSYTGTLFLAALFPGRLGLLQPPVIVLVSMAGAFAMSAWFVTKTVRAIYGTTNVRESISRHQCDMTTVKRGRCQNWALRSKFRGEVDPKKREYCRWHYIAIATVQKNRTRMSAAVIKQMQAALCLVCSFISLWIYVVQGGIVWPAVFVLSLGASIRYVSDSIIIPWQALSRLVIWVKLVAAGLVLEILGGIAILVLVGKHQELMQPVVSSLWRGSDWLLFGPVILYLFAAFFVALAVDSFIQRILFYRSSSFASLVVLSTFLPLWHMLESALSQHWLFSRWIGDQFWQTVIGGEVRTSLGLAFIAAFYPPFSLLRQRKKEGDSTAAAYFATSMSLFGPVLVAVMSVMAGRYLLHYSGIVGAAPFVAATVIVSILLTLVLRPLARR